MRYTSFKTLDKEVENNLRDIIGCYGEFTQLESTMYLLDGLMGWCELCFNDDTEVKEYELLTQAYKLLEEVYKSYEKR